MTFNRFLIGYFTVLSVFLQPVRADTLKGYDTLAIARLDKKLLAQEIKPHSALGMLQGTFGDAIPNLEFEINTGKVAAFRVHLFNGTCVRNHNCEPAEPRLDNLKVLGERAAAFESLHARHQSVSCYLSPVLEHDEKNKELVNKWVATLKKSAPSCVIVISSFTGFVPVGLLTEKHGNQSTGDIVSNDGQSFYDADPKNYWKHGKIITFAWIHSFNQRKKGETKWTPPSKRTLQPTKQEYERINALMR